VREDIEDAVVLDESDSDLTSDLKKSKKSWLSLFVYSAMAAGVGTSIAGVSGAVVGGLATFVLVCMFRLVKGK
jgi:hypothetical protein